MVDFDVIWFPHTSMYKEMVANAGSDERVIAALGEPIRPTWTWLGYYSSGGAYTAANFELCDFSPGANATGTYVKVTDRGRYARLPIRARHAAMRDRAA